MFENSNNFPSSCAPLKGISHPHIKLKTWHEAPQDIIAKKGDFSIFSLAKEIALLGTMQLIKFLKHKEVIPEHIMKVYLLVNLSSDGR